jgi:hypothetical protein
MDLLQKKYLNFNCFYLISCQYLPLAKVNRKARREIEEKATHITQDLRL